jgi:RNA polymerase sigma-70 factor (ECF subfamily)
MPGRADNGAPSGTKGAPTRAITYCVVPRDLASKLHDCLRRHFAADPSIEIVVEHRASERRMRAERRAVESPGAPAADRRRVRGALGRRVDDRRATALPVDAPALLPRKARPFVDRLAFCERLEPSTQELEDVDTARLVVRFQSGDDDVFADLYKRYFNRVYAYMRVALRDHDEAEDGTQHVFANVFEALPAYERRAQPFRAWLFRIVRNTTISQLRKHGHVELTDPADLGRLREDGLDGGRARDTEPGLSALDWITDRDLVVFVERLPVTQRQVLILRFMLDLSSDEIAGILDLTPANVRMLQSRAIRFLEERLRSVGRTPRVAERHRRSRRCERQAIVLRGRRYALIRQ